MYKNEKKVLLNMLNRELQIFRNLGVIKSQIFVWLAAYVNPRLLLHKLFKPQS